ncbi:hypothetical protein MRB53_020804, partial [Persea americana]
MGCAFVSPTAWEAIVFDTTSECYSKPGGGSVEEFPSKMD